MMNIIDLVLGGILFCGALEGWRLGFFHQAVSIGDFLVALVLARFLSPDVSLTLATHWDIPQTGARILAFVLVLTAVYLLLSVLARLLTRTAETLCLGGVNKLAGALIAVFKYAVFLCVLVALVDTFHWIGNHHTEASALYRPFVRAGTVLLGCVQKGWQSFVTELF